MNRPRKRLPRSLATAALCIGLGTGLCTGLAYAQLPPPLPYVQNLEPIEGRTLVLRQVVCEAPNKPQTLGRLYLRRLENGRYQAARLEYNEQGKYILENGKSTPRVGKYFEKYIYQQQDMNLGTLDTLMGLWRFFGMRFSFENVTYRCKMF